MSFNEVEDKTQTGSAGEAPASGRSQSEPLKPTLAPAPVPVSSAWGTTKSSPPATVESWPTPDIVTAKPKSTPTVVTGKEKWVPIKANVMFNNGKSGKPAKRQSFRNKKPQKQKKKLETPNDDTTKQSEISKYNKAPFVPVYQPPNPLIALAKQIDYYFSPQNLVKDIYLRKQMNSQGFVPLIKVANFFRVQALSGGDVQAVVQSLKICVNVECVGEEDIKLKPRENAENWVLPLDQRDEAGKD